MRSENTTHHLRIRKGPAGRGQYYTHVHGDTRYNRRSVRQETHQLIQDSIDDLAGDYPLVSNRQTQKPSRLEIVN